MILLHWDDKKVLACSCMSSRSFRLLKPAMRRNGVWPDLARPGCFSHLSLISFDLLMLVFLSRFFGRTTMSIEALCFLWTNYHEHRGTVFLDAATWQGQIQAPCCWMFPILRFWARLGILQSSPGTIKKLGLGTRIFRGRSHGISRGTKCCQAPPPDPL